MPLFCVHHTIGDTVWAHPRAFFALVLLAWIAFCAALIGIAEIWARLVRRFIAKKLEALAEIRPHWHD